MRSDRDPPRRARTAAPGFSLIEVLAALVVTMLLLLALTPLVNQMLSTWRRGTDTVRTVELATRGLDQLRRDLRQAIVWTGYGRFQNLIGFQGRQTSFSFPVATGLDPDEYGIEMVSVSVDTSRDGRALVRRRAAVSGSSYGTLADPVTLFSGPYRYTITYIGADGQDLPVWISHTEIPIRIRLEIFDEAGRLAMGTMEFATYATLAAACNGTAALPGCPVQPARELNEFEKMMMGSPQ